MLDTLARTVEAGPPSTRAQAAAADVQLELQHMLGLGFYSCDDGRGALRWMLGRDPALAWDSPTRSDETQQAGVARQLARAARLCSLCVGHHAQGDVASAEACKGRAFEIYHAAT